MKLGLSPSLLVCFLLVGFPLFGAEQDRKSLGHCPNGHKTLKDIPIIYGCDPREPKKWDAGIKAGKFWPGGSGGGELDARIAVRCTKCGFTHVQYWVDYPGFWTRESADPKSFKPAFTDLLSTFPVPPPKLRRGEITYNQDLEDDLRVNRECIDYHSAESIDTVSERISEWLKSHDLNLDMTTKHYDPSEAPFDSSRDIIKWSQPGHPFDPSLEAEVTFNHTTRRSYVRFRHNIGQERDKEEAAEWRKNAHEWMQKIGGTSDEKAFQRDVGNDPAPAPILRLKFQTHDKEDKTFQINRLDGKTPTDFLKLGDTITGTRYKLSKFTDKGDASELEIVHAQTGRTVVLILNKVVEIPAPDAPSAPAK